jgi:hypothetical protein
MWWHVVWQISIITVNEPATTIFREKGFLQYIGVYLSLDMVSSQNTGILIVTVMST